MKIGICLPNIGKFATAKNLMDVAIEADKEGLDSAWVSDHIATPKHFDAQYPYSKNGKPPFSETDPILEALTSLAFVAAKTERIMLGTSVLVLPLRQSTLVAKQFGTICAMAPNRVIVGVGVGWLEDEFGLLNVDFQNRGSAFDRGLTKLVSLLDPIATEHDLTVMEPRPSSRPELWIGGGGTTRSIERIASHADAWFAGGGSPTVILPILEKIRKSESKYQRKAPVSLTSRIGCKPEKNLIFSRLDTLSNIGCSHAIIDPIAESLDDFRGLIKYATQWSSIQT